MSLETIQIHLSPPSAAVRTRCVLLSAQRYVSCQPHTSTAPQSRRLSYPGGEFHIVTSWIFPMISSSSRRKILNSIQIPNIRRFGIAPVMMGKLEARFQYNVHRNAGGAYRALIKTMTLPCSWIFEVDAPIASRSCCCTIQTLRLLQSKGHSRKRHVRIQLGTPSSSALREIECRIRKEYVLA